MSLIAALGCRQGPAQSALLALARLEPSNVGTCVGVEVRSASDSLLAETLMPRVPGQDEYKVAIARGELPAEVVLRAFATFGAKGGCEEPQARSGESAKVSAGFGLEVGRVELAVASPSPPDDEDGDGFIGVEKGGPDCDDDAPWAHPGAAEDCGGGADLDCDGKKGCDDEDCGAGTCAGPAVALVFVTPAQSVTAGACSAQVKLELRDGSDRRAQAAGDLKVALSAASPGGFALFSDPACLAPSAEVLLPARSTGAGFYFQGTRTQTVEVGATASGVPPVAQPAQVLAGPLAGLTFETDPLMLLAGGCSGAVRLAARDAFGNLAPPAAPLPVELRASPDAGFFFFGDTACQSPGSAGLDAGQALASFSFRGWSPGQVELFAGAGGLPPTMQSQRLVPQVRSAGCTLDAGETGVTCPLDPPLTGAGRTLLWFQATNGGDATPNSSELRCSLQGESAVECSRIGTNGGATIRYQTAELPSGLQVQSLETPCDAGVTNVDIPVPVASLAQSFVLFSLEQDGQVVDFDDFRVVRLTAPGTVEIQAACSNTARHSIQVAELAGANVTRGLIAPGLAGDAGVVVYGADAGLGAVDLARTVLLYSYRGTNPPLNIGMCGRMLRGELPGPNTVRFSRAAGLGGCRSDPIDAIAFERVEFPPGTRVQQVTTTLGAGVLSADQAISPVELSRSIAFTGGQMASGQGMGEGSYAADDVLGEMVARLELSAPNVLRLTRGSALGTAKFTTYVVELAGP